MRLVRVLVFIVIPLLTALATYKFMRRAFLDPVDPTNTQPVIVEIQHGKTFRQISSDIASKGIVRYPMSLELLARFKKVDLAIHAGEYELSPSMSPNEVLAKLMSGQTVTRMVTITPGSSVWTIGELMQQAGLFPKEEFDKSVADARLLVKAGILGPSFEGYLYPETYNFSRPITVEKVIWTMLEEGEKNWTDAFTKRADELKLSRHEILTLASIIEKETGVLEEQKTISSVFHNRLNKGMRLQSDPTVIYGIPDFNGNLTRAHLETPHQYNTYTNLGLPPGPICNPGLSAIEAALFPEPTNFLFFVADGTGKHVFTSTLEEHNDAVNRYQRKARK